MLQAQVDANQRPGATTAEQQRIKALERENRDLKEANEILKAASIVFAREQYRMNTSCVEAPWRRSEPPR